MPRISAPLTRSFVVVLESGAVTVNACRFTWKKLPGMPAVNLEKSGGMLSKHRNDDVFASADPLLSASTVGAAKVPRSNRRRAFGTGLRASVVTGTTGSLSACIRDS
jgi:hypothetical protein